MNYTLCASYLFNSCVLIIGGETFCRGIYVAVADSGSRVAVGLDGAIAALQVDVVENDVSAWDSVTACKFHGLLTL